MLYGQVFVVLLYFLHEVLDAQLLLISDFM